MAKTTFTVGAQYDVPVGIGTLTTRLDYSYRSKLYFHPSTLSAPFNDVIAAPGVGLLDGRITLSDLKVWRVDTALSLWARNITNKHYRAWGIDFGGLGYAGNTYGLPQTFGIELTASF